MATNNDPLEKHWRVTVQVQEVIPAQEIREGNGYTAKINVGAGQTMIAKTERRVVDRFQTSVAADSEDEAYRKAMALLEVNRPEPVFTEPQPPEQHLHRASCDDAGGNRMCGYPDGLSIASPR